MDKVQKQRGSIVLHKETRDGADYIRIEYANSQAVALLLAQDTGMEMAGNGSAYIASAAFSLPDFYDRYSPHAYIDYSRVYEKGAEFQVYLKSSGSYSKAKETERDTLLFDEYHQISETDENKHSIYNWRDRKSVV